MSEIPKETMEQVQHHEFEHDERDQEIPSEFEINQPQASIYREALERYPNDVAIDKEQERRPKRKFDKQTLLLLGVCYFFYVSSFYCFS